MTVKLIFKDVTIRLATKFVRVFHDVTEKPEWTFWPTQYLVSLGQTQDLTSFSGKYYRESKWSLLYIYTVVKTC